MKEKNERNPNKMTTYYPLMIWHEERKKKLLPVKVPQFFFPVLQTPKKFEEKNNLFITNRRQVYLCIIAPAQI